MMGVADIADGETIRVRGDGVEVMGAIGKGFDRAEGSHEGRVIHGTAALTILLVVEVEAHAVGLLEYR